MPPLPYEADADGLRIRVRLTPRGGRDSLEGIETLADGRVMLKARVRAAPEKGLANAALEALIAKTLRVPKSSVSVVAGGTSRVKVVAVSGSSTDLTRTIEALLKSQIRNSYQTQGRVRPPSDSSARATTLPPRRT